MAEDKKNTAEPTVTHGFKGFDKDFKCRGYQFEPGHTFEEEQNPEICRHGFHFCEHPLNCFEYYPPYGSRYCAVSTDCVSQQTHNDTKRVTKKISIGAEITIAGLVKAAVEYVWNRATIEDGAHATGDQGAASATGDQGAASATGYLGAASATGDQGAASATGDQGAASATGDQGAASATGDQGAASATGYKGAASATGDQGAASATGYKGAASATGYQGAASATGYLGAASATGDQGAASATGEHSIAVAAGLDSKAKAKLGCAICCVERDEEGGYIIAVKAALVDGEKVKADTWYTLRDGEFIEVE